MRQKRLHRDGLRRLYEGTSDFVPALLLPVIAVIDVIHPAQARNHPIVEILFPSSAQIQFHSLPEEARLPPHPSVSPELGHPWIFWILGFFFRSWKLLQVRAQTPRQTREERRSLPLEASVSSTSPCQTTHVGQTSRDVTRFWKGRTKKTA